jgi:hypothetical protein
MAMVMMRIAGTARVHNTQIVTNAASNNSYFTHYLIILPNVLQNRTHKPVLFRLMVVCSTCPDEFVLRTMNVRLLLPTPIHRHKYRTTAPIKSTPYKHQHISNNKPLLTISFYTVCGYGPVSRRPAAVQHKTGIHPATLLHSNPQPAEGHWAP